MTVTVNGDQREIAEGTSVETLLAELGLKGPMAVELNKHVCPRRMHNETKLNAGDVLEIVTIVGGG